MRLTWVQPEDLVGHALHQARQDRVDVDDLREQWVAAGGDPAPLHSGASDVPAPDPLRATAVRILDEIDQRPSPFDTVEPTGLAEIRAVAPAWAQATEPSGARPRSPSPWPSPWPSPSPSDELIDRVHGAWLGRAAGCLLGKPVEKIPRRGIREILEATGRWPLAGWFTAEGLPDDVAARRPWNRRSAVTSLAENIDGMPEDDDLNFPMLNLSLLQAHGAGLGTEDVAAAWLAELPAGRVFTAERVAYRNLLLGITPPRTARVRNPFRDWIGAQIRGDVFGWVYPGDPARAAELAWHDAVLSHTRNGVYGEMFVAAACAASLVADSVDEVLDAGLSVIPASSRYAEAVRFARALPGEYPDFEDGMDAVERRYGDLHWVHVLNNAALTVAALVYAGQTPPSVTGDRFSRAITLVVSGGWDTDSNGATVGSVLGGLLGASSLPEYWIAPLRNRVSSTLSGFDGIGFDELARRTLAVARDM
ncbi:ADP-ribosylglycohydrolase family protein [Phytoactinopolyspora halotolerans]|uniref:ADP-ribosylglycohydrolase family protein n=1 Tax=Phytoactinopolyspora halotolerans TaxID=1981512 RepID=A0A6L9S674_9ACTN|nr:ADP-ribosylglycohydrolase family protein [Phytoactinopolyspora halotolerans]NEE00955.1 ADP-ribosylglycohydrolase family protein [Phytoactinopolyspora halotolerans]